MNSGEDDEGDDQRQLADEPGRREAHSGDHHLDADELERDIGHRRDEAGDGDGERQPAIAEAAAHEIGGRDVAVLLRDRPQPREHDEDEGIDQDRIGHGEEGERTGAEGEGRNGDEGVGRIEVAAEQEPGDQRPEAAARKAPFMQEIEIAAPPIGRGEADECHEREEEDEDAERDPVQFHDRFP